MNHPIFILAFLLFAFGSLLTFNINSAKIAEFMEYFLTSDGSGTLFELAREKKGKKKKNKLKKLLLHYREALSATDTDGRNSFGRLCLFSLILSIVGASAAVLIKNLFLLPIFFLAGLVIPFMLALRSLENFDRQINEELETSLSVITSTYLRTRDLVSAITINLSNIKQPLRSVFKAFCDRSNMISADLVRNLEIMRDTSGIDSSVFYEWCDILISCRDDFSNSDTLVPTVAKLTEIRLVNSELQTKLQACRREYLTMVIIVVSNIPLLFLINKDWFDALVGTPVGKFSLAVCALSILITAIIMFRLTKPLDYGGDK